MPGTSRRGTLWLRGRGMQAGLYHNVEALFLLLTHLMQYVVDDSPFRYVGWGRRKQAEKEAGQLLPPPAILCRGRGGARMRVRRGQCSPPPQPPL